MNLGRKPFGRIAALLVASAAGVVAWGSSRPSRSAVPAFEWNFPVLSPEFSAARYWRQPAAGPRGDLPDGYLVTGGDQVVRYGRVHPCGSMGVPVPLPNYTVEEMVGDMTPVITAAYRGCRAVTVERFDPRVPVAAYPEGHFGDLARAGMLVTGQNEFADEARLEVLYALLMEAVAEADEPADYWRDWEATEAAEAASMDRYRREPGFVPDVAFEFSGEVALRGELNVGQGRLLLLSEKHWASLKLDGATASALAGFLTEKR